MAGPNADTGLTKSALDNRRVRRVLAAFAAVTLGEWVLGTTIAVHAYAAGGAVAVGLVRFRFAAAALAGLWTTQLAEHARRHPVLALTAAARAATTGAATAALALGLPFGVVIALVWLDAAAGSGYRPAQAALLPTLTRTPGELTGAVGLLSNVKSTGQMVGALLGGVLVAGRPAPVRTAARRGRPGRRGQRLDAATALARGPAALPTRARRSLTRSTARSGPPRWILLPAWREG